MTFPIINNYYTLLGVHENATIEEITSAYNNKIQIYYSGGETESKSDSAAMKAFQWINIAYEALKDPYNRKIYDDSLNKHRLIFPRTSGEHPLSKKKVITDPIQPEKLEAKELDFIEKEDVNSIDEYLSEDDFQGSATKYKILLISFLYESCKKGKLGVVKYLIEKKGVSPEQRINDGFTFSGPVFKAAAEYGHLYIVKYLFEEHGVDIEAQGLSEGTLSTALSKAASRGQLEVVKYLLLKGANPNPKISSGNIIDCAIFSGSFEVFRTLLEAGSKLNEYHLMKALEAGNLPIVQCILKEKPGLDHHRSYLGKTLAYHTVKGGNVALLEMLMKNEGLSLLAPKQENDTLQKTISDLLFAAGESLSIEMLRFLLIEKKITQNCPDTESQETFKQILTKAIAESPFSNFKVKQSKVVDVLIYLFEELEWFPSKEWLLHFVINNCEYSGIEVNAYLQGFFLEQGEKKELLRLVATKGLEGLSLGQLLWLFNAKLIKRGEYHFNLEIHDHLESRMISFDDLKNLAIEGSIYRQYAFFYYLNYYHKNDLSRLKFLVEELGADIHDLATHQGISPIDYASSSGGENAIWKYLINRMKNTKK
ncbi:MAG: hypothetical protein Tsb0021_14230 [Chlamydiales bacterium]